MIKILFKKMCDITGIPRYFLRQCYTESKLALVRIYGTLPFQKKKINAINNMPKVCLLFGCGDTKYDNWVGIDCFFGKNVDLKLDLRRTLPFKNDSVALCYSEHFLEHLYYDEAQRHLSEVYRVLKPDGVYRVVVPHARMFMKKYLENDMEFFKLAHPWEDRPLVALYHIVNWGGDHRGIYDMELISYFARRAGFSGVNESAPNASEIEELRTDRSEPQRVAESLYVELKK